MYTTKTPVSEALLKSQITHFFEDLHTVFPVPEQQRVVVDVLYIPTPEEVSAQPAIARYKYRWLFILSTLLKSETSFIHDMCAQLTDQSYTPLVQALKQVALLCESDTTHFLKYLLRLQVTLFNNRDIRAPYQDMYYRLTENRYSVAISHDLDMSIHDTAKLWFAFTLVRRVLVQYGHLDT